MAFLRKVIPGQPMRPKASDWNAFVDVARGDRNRMFDQGAAAGEVRDETVVVRNVVSLSSGADAPRGAVLAISGASYAGLLEVGQPADPPERIKTLVAQAAIAESAVGRAYWYGECEVIVSAEDHAIVSPGDRIGAQANSWLAVPNEAGELIVLEVLAEPYVRCWLVPGAGDAEAGGADTFLGLADTPESYPEVPNWGLGKRPIPRVNLESTALEFGASFLDLYDIRDDTDWKLPIFKYNDYIVWPSGAAMYPWQPPSDPGAAYQHAFVAVNKDATALTLRPMQFTENTNLDVPGGGTDIPAYPITSYPGGPIIMQRGLYSGWLQCVQGITVLAGGVVESVYMNLVGVVNGLIVSKEKYTAWGPGSPPEDPPDPPHFEPPEEPEYDYWWCTLLELWTLAMGGCNGTPQWWQHLVLPGDETGSNISEQCALTPGGSWYARTTILSGPYATMEEASAVCRPWYCIHTDRDTYRCGQNVRAGESIDSGPYVTLADCQGVCDESWYCVNRTGVGYICVTEVIPETDEIMSGPHETEEACAAVCGWFCIERSGVRMCVGGWDLQEGDVIISSHVSEALCLAACVAPIDPEKWYCIHEARWYGYETAPCETQEPDDVYIVCDLGSYLSAFLEAEPPILSCVCTEYVLWLTNWVMWEVIGGPFDTYQLCAASDCAEQYGGPGPKPCGLG